MQIDCTACDLAGISPAKHKTHFHRHDKKTIGNNYLPIKVWILKHVSSCHAAVWHLFLLIWRILVTLEGGITCRLGVSPLRGVLLGVTKQENMFRLL